MKIESVFLVLIKLENGTCDWETFLSKKDAQQYQDSVLENGINGVKCYRAVVLSDLQVIME